MTLSTRAQEIYTQINKEDTKLGDLRKIAKTIKKDHDLAMELWAAGGFFPRQLAILIMDKKELAQAEIEELAKDIQIHNHKEKTHLADWLLANQLSKGKRTLALVETWEDSEFSVLRRIFWFHQGRLRWTGKTPPANTEELLKSIEAKLASEAPEVQWMMNFTAAWIGIYDESNRARCIALGEKHGLYKEEKAVKGCTPSYLPEFIRIEVGKLGR